MKGQGHLRNSGRFSHTRDRLMLIVLGIGLKFTAIATPGCLLQRVCFCWEQMNQCKGTSLYQPVQCLWMGWTGALDGTRESTLLVSVFLSGHSLPVTVCPGELILSCSGLNVVSSSSSDPPRH